MNPLETEWKSANNLHKYMTFLDEKTLNDSIEYLDMTNVFVDNGVIKTIGKLMNLRELKLVFPEEDASLLRLGPLEALSRLSVLQIHSLWEISKGGLIDLVKKLEGLRSLTLSTNYSVLVYETYNEIIDIVHERRKSLVILVKQSVQETPTIFSCNFFAIERNVRRLIHEL